MKHLRISYIIVVVNVALYKSLELFYKISLMKYEHIKGKLAYAEVYHVAL